MVINLIKISQKRNPRMRILVWEDKESMRVTKVLLQKILGIGMTSPIMVTKSM